MKRILAFILIFIMIMSSVSCTKKKDEPDDAVILKYKKGTEGWDNIQNMLDEGNWDYTIAEIE